MLILDCNPGARGINISINENIDMKKPINCEATEGFDTVHDIYDNSETHTWDRFYSPLGTEDEMFTGKFKGILNDNEEYKTISNLQINNTDKSGVGLVGYISNGRIENIKLESSNIQGRNYVGGVVGFAHKSVIRNCAVEATIITGISDSIGGLAGEVHNSEIYNSGLISTTIEKGGLKGNIVAYNYNSYITKDDYPASTSGPEKPPEEETRPSEDPSSGGGNNGGTGGDFDYDEPNNNFNYNENTGINPF